MKLRTFFLLITLAFTAVALATIGVLVSATSSAEWAASHTNEAIHSVHAAVELRESLLSHNRESFLASLTNSTEHVAAREAAEADVLHWKKEIGSHVQTAVEDSLVRRCEHAVSQYLSTRAQLESAGLEPLQVYNGAAQVLDEARALTGELVDVNVAQAAAYESDLESKELFATWFGYGAAALLLVAGLGLVGGLRYVIYEPLAALRENLVRYGSGDADARVPVRGPRDLQDIALVFNDMAAKLACQREAQLRFVAAIAHELRNPLSVIGFSTELLTSSSEMSNDRRAVTVAAVRRQVAYVDRLVSDLLDTARIEAGHLELRRERWDLRDLARDVASLYEGTSELHRVVIDIPEEPVVCDCDPVRVTQVLNNFASNAIKYSPHGGIVRFRVDRERAPAEAVVSVEDEGMGIASEDLPRIFEPFRRTDATRDTIPGVGLGLSVSQRIARAHGGSIEVASGGQGAGSSFRLHLPSAN